jgi:TatD DNase family protein
MKLVDTHAHLYLKQFAADRSQVLENARKAGLTKIYLPNIDVKSIDPMIELEAQSEGFCEAMMGLHPCSVKADFEKSLEVIEDWLNKRPFCAVGEIGLDLYWDKTTLEIQQVAFRQQIRWAKKLGIPIVVHTRESMDQALDLIESELDESLSGIIHCFGGTPEQAQRIIDMGFYMGIGGVITYKKSGLAQTLASVPLEHLVLETDAPYLTPVPFRGKRNESAYIKIIAQHLADAKKTSIEEIARLTTANAEKIFRKKQG